jgi:hypothetical protein
VTPAGRRRPAYLAAVAGLAVTGVLAPGAQVGHATVTGATVGHVAYVTAGGRVMAASVRLSGNSTRFAALGPVTTARHHHKVSVLGFSASGDGNWLGWLEVVTKRNGEPTNAKPTLVVRELKPDQVWVLRTTAYPVGFAGDQLVVYDGNGASVVVLQPTPHLEPVPNTRYPEAAYPQGVVQVVPLADPPGPRHTERLELVTLAGDTTVLHDYVMRRDDPRLPERAFVSPDGNKLAVERGDHTDFAGVGPTSVVDTYSLSSGSSVRIPTGHFGKRKAGWRVASISFAWPNDELWVVWERATKHGATSVVAVRQHGEWRSILPHGIAVAANSDGYVVAQTGKYQVRAGGLRVTRVPTGDAVLLRDRSTRVMSIEGSAFAWIAAL